MNEARDFDAVRALVEPRAKELIARYPQARSALLPILHEFQSIEGWVSPEAMSVTGEWLGVPLSVVESTASFYTLFYRKPVGKYMVQPCRGLACIINGAEEAMAHFRERLGIGHLETTSDGTFSYEEVECLAACDRAPCAQVNLEFVYHLDAAKIDAMIAAMRAGTYDVGPAPQSAVPPRSWHVSDEPERRSAGAQGIADPNSPGGIGDASGRGMLERLVRDPRPIVVKPTNERLVQERVAALRELDEEKT